MTQNLIGHVGHIDAGKKSILDTFLLLGLMEMATSHRGFVLVCDQPGDVEHCSVRGHKPTILHLDELPFYLHDADRPDRREPAETATIDPSVVWWVNERMRKAEEKRERKNLKRLKAAGRVKP